MPEQPDIDAWLVRIIRQATALDAHGRGGDATTVLADADRRLTTLLDEEKRR